MSFLWSGGAYLTGALALRRGYRTPVRLGGALVAVAAATMMAGAIGRSALALVIGSGFLGAGMGLSVTAMNVAAQERVPAQFRGTATSVIQFSRTMGGTLFVSALGGLLAHVAGAGREGGGLPEVEPLARGLVGVFAGALTAAVIALLAALAFPETGSSPNPGEVK